MFNKIRDLSEGEHALLKKYNDILEERQRLVDEARTVLSDIVLAFNRGEGPVVLRDGALWSDEDR